MNFFEILMILLPAPLGIFYLSSIKSRDIYNDQPVTMLPVVSVLGGALAFGVSLLLYRHVEVGKAFFDVTVKVGLIAEFSKLIALYAIHPFFKKNFKEISDYIIYMSGISLAFCIFDLLYFGTESTSRSGVLFLNSLSSIIGSVTFSGYIGIAIYIHKRVKQNYTGILISVLLASFAHALYEAVLFPETFHILLEVLFDIVLISFLALQFWLLKIAFGFSKIRGRLTDKILIPENEILELQCKKCGSSTKSKALSFWKIKMGVCEHCGNHVIRNENIEYLFQYFLPMMHFHEFLKTLPADERLNSFDDKNKVLFDGKTQSLSANIHDLSTWLNKANREGKEEIFSIPVAGSLLWYLGLRHLASNR